MRRRVPSLFAFASIAASSAWSLVLTIGIPAGAVTTAAEPDGVAVLVREINAARRRAHVRLLRVDERLCAIALSHARDMLSRNFVGHTNPDGLDPFDRMTRAHYPFGYAGENLGIDENLESIARDFFSSPEHRRNILEPHYSRVGIGTVDSRDGTIVVEDFSD